MRAIGLRGAAVWLDCRALVLLQEQRVQAEGGAESLGAAEGIFIFRGLVVKRGEGMRP